LSGIGFPWLSPGENPVKGAKDGSRYADDHPECKLVAINWDINLNKNSLGLNFHPVICVSPRVHLPVNPW